MLRNPDPGGWPSWRRTLDHRAYSPLVQINRRNVCQRATPSSFAPARLTPEPSIGTSNNLFVFALPQ